MIWRWYLSRSGDFGGSQDTVLDTGSVICTWKADAGTRVLMVQNLTVQPTTSHAVIVYGIFCYKTGYLTLGNRIHLYYCLGCKW